MAVAVDRQWSILDPCCNASLSSVWAIHGQRREERAPASLRIAVRPCGLRTRREPALGRYAPHPDLLAPMTGAQHNVPSPAKRGKASVGRMGALVGMCHGVACPPLGLPRARGRERCRPRCGRLGIFEPACKPGSVVGNHSSRAAVASRLKQPTRRQRGPRQHLPIWSCSERGLPCHACYQPCGALLPHPFTLTCTGCPAIGGLLSVALAVGLRRPGVTWRSALWSPDFPPRARGTQRLPGWLEAKSSWNYPNSGENRAEISPLTVRRMA